MKSSLLLGLTATLSLATGGSASAHHSFVAQFDPSRAKTVTGAVSKLEWANPHARFYVLAKDDKGEDVTWEIELGSPNALLRYGWRRDTVKIGDSITVNGFVARDGTHLVNAKSLKLANGKVIEAGSSRPTTSK